MQIARQECSICCGAIQDLTCLSQPTVSHHIKILVDSGVLISTKEGRNVNLDYQPGDDETVVYVLPSTHVTFLLKNIDVFK